MLIVNLNSLKKSLVVGALALSFSGSVVAAEAVKIGIVDLQRALQETKEGKTAKSSLEKEFQDKKKKLDKEQDELRKLSEDFQKKSMALSPEARNQRGGELQKRMQEWQETVQRSQGDIQKREASLTRPILEGLRDLIPSISKEKSLNLVLEMNTAGLLYADNKTDITEELIKKFDARKKK